MKKSKSFATVKIYPEFELFSFFRQFFHDFRKKISINKINYYNNYYKETHEKGHSKAMLLPGGAVVNF